MKIAVLGASGRTGRLVVDALLAGGHEVSVLTRRPWHGPTAARVVRGDALDREAVDALVGGCEAVICALGPTPGSPANLCARSTEVLIASMQRADVRSVVAVTGAMVGHPALGRFYRWLAQRVAIKATLDDRRRQEQLLRASGLRCTLVRPPRLTNGRGTGALRVGGALRIGPMAAVARADLARVLVRAAVDRTWEGEAVAVLKSYSARRPLRVLGAWLWRMGLAELAGLAAVTAAALAFVVALGIPVGLGNALLFLASIAAAGAVAGALLGALPGAMIRRVFPALPLGRFTLASAAAGAAAWALGMLPSALEPWPGAAAAWDLPPAVDLGFLAIIGAAGGALLGLVQSFSVRGFAPLGARWVAASALGWALGLPLSLTTTTLPGLDGGTLTSLALAVSLGFAGGVIAGVPTGVWLLWTLARQERADAEAGHLARGPHHPLLA
jgi:putative NADH-flavin reductase